MNIPKFTPTKDQISAAENVFIAMAFHQMVKAIFDKIESDLLSTRLYHYDEEYYSQKWKDRGFNYPEDRVIMEAKDSYQMAGMNKLDTPEYEGTDSDKYYKAFHFVTKDKFIHAENTECMASNNIMKFENKLIEATENIHHLKLENIIMHDHRLQLVDLLLKMFSNFAAPSEEKKRQYHDSFIHSLQTV